MADTYNFCIDSGASKEIPINWEDSNGDPMDLTQYCAYLQVRPTQATNHYTLFLLGDGGGSAGSCSSWAEPTSSIGSEWAGTQIFSGAITLTATDPNITVLFTPAMTQQLSAQTYVYDLKLVDLANNSFTTRLLEGRITVDPEVTRTHETPS